MTNPKGRIRMLKVILGAFILSLSSLSAFAACPEKIEIIKAFAGFDLPVGDCSIELYHSNGVQALYPKSGSWYGSNGNQVYYPDSGSIYYAHGMKAYYPNSGSWFHENGTQAYFSNTGSWFHSNGVQAYSLASSRLFQSDGSKSESFTTLTELEMLKFVEIIR